MAVAAADRSGDDRDAQDAQQEAFLQVHRGLPSFRGEARFSSAWSRGRCGRACTAHG